MGSTLERQGSHLGLLRLPLLTGAVRSGREGDFQCPDPFSQPRQNGVGVSYKPTAQSRVRDPWTLHLPGRTWPLRFRRSDSEAGLTWAGAVSLCAIDRCSMPLRADNPPLFLQRKCCKRSWMPCNRKCRWSVTPQVPSPIGRGVADTSSRRLRPTRHRARAKGSPRRALAVGLLVTEPVRRRERVRGLAPTYRGESGLCEAYSAKARGWDV